MKEADIRPDELFTEFLRLSDQDSARYFHSHDLAPRHCPACDGEDSTPAFAKNGFHYRRCAACGTLYQNPVPSPQAYENYYRDGAAARYFAEVFLPAVLETRRQSIFVPRVERIAALLPKRPNRCLVEIGAGHGVFLEEWRKRYPGDDLRAIEPHPGMAARCRAIGAQTLETVAEKADSWHAVADLAVSFEVLEHVPDPARFLAAMARILKPGGMAVVTTLGVDGFDIAQLWEKSRSIFPPHHINFCSETGFHRLFARAGFRDISVTTPGKLDLDIVGGAVRRGEFTPDRFVATLLSKPDETRQAFQQFLADNNLSSHCWIVGTRPD